MNRAHPGRGLCQWLLAGVASAGLLAGCATARHGGWNDGQAGPAPVRAVFLISAQAEWKALAPRLAGATLHDSPYGQWLVHRLGAEDVVFFHGGYGKVAAAGSTQYAIDRWHPALLVNLGTAGGFGEGVAVGDVVLATRTVIYDIIERMGDPYEAIADFATTLDVSAWPARLRHLVSLAPLVSADRDLAPEELERLRTRYQAPAGDWESGAIAFVASHNRTRLVILRVVSDVVGPAGSATYGDPAAWERVTRQVMSALLDLAVDALPDLLAAPGPTR
jgi:adenosylhomocysteine nucleosidase